MQSRWPTFSGIEIDPALNLLQHLFYASRNFLSRFWRLSPIASNQKSKAITCNLLKAREKSTELNDLLLNDWKDFKAITERSNRNCVFTSGSHLKTALKKYCYLMFKQLLFCSNICRWVFRFVYWVNHIVQTWLHLFGYYVTSKAKTCTNGFPCLDGIPCGSRIIPVRMQC